MDEALDKKARAARSRLMKRLSKKIAMKKKISAKKMASPDKLKSRAKKKAHDILYKKLTKGRDVSISEKEKIEKILAKKKAALAKLAKKLLPVIKSAEKDRFKKMKEKK